MKPNTSLEDIDTLIKAIKYSQTLVNQADAGVELSLDYLKNYAFFGKVNISNIPGIEIHAPSVDLGNYSPNQFFQYSAFELSKYFALPTNIIGAKATFEEVTDRHLLSIDYVDNNSLLSEDIFFNYGKPYSEDITFDLSEDSSLTLFPLSVYDGYFSKQGETITIPDNQWSVNIGIGTHGRFIKSPDKDICYLSHIDGSSIISSKSVSMTDSSLTKEQILEPVVKEDLYISEHAIMSPESHELSNILTLEKLLSKDYTLPSAEKKLAFTDLLTAEELSIKLTDFLESSNGSVLFQGDDIFLTYEQSIQLFAHLIYRISGYQIPSAEL